MRRITPYFYLALAVSVLTIAGCDAEPDPRPDAASGSAPSIPSSSPAPTTTESSPAPPAAASPAAQDALDEQLRQAAWNNDVALATELIGAGADVNAKDTATESAYLIATSEGYLDLLNLTLAHGAAIDDKDSWNGTGLIRASERGHALVVGRLLQAGIAPDHVNRIGYQAIHEAIWLGEDSPEYRDTLRVLIAGGVELTRPSSREALTPLQMATQRNYPGIEATLRTALDPVEIADPNATLLAAAGSGDPEQAAMALRAGADIEARDSNQRTPLLLAATNDNVDVARLLVALGADPDVLDDRHDTPWLVTGVTGSVAMHEALLPAAPDKQSSTDSAARR